MLEEQQRGQWAGKEHINHRAREDEVKVGWWGAAYNVEPLKPWMRSFSALTLSLDVFESIWS